MQQGWEGKGREWGIKGGEREKEGNGKGMEWVEGGKSKSNQKVRERKKGREERSGRTKEEKVWEDRKKREGSRRIFQNPFCLKDAKNRGRKSHDTVPLISLKTNLLEKIICDFAQTYTMDRWTLR